MNVYEWILASAVFVLWLYVWGLSHRIGVLRKDAEWNRSDISRESDFRYQSVCSIHKRLNDMLATVNIHTKVLDKLDPPRRRATDKPKAAKR